MNLQVADLELFSNSSFIIYHFSNPMWCLKLKMIHSFCSISAIVVGKFVLLWYSKNPRGSLICFDEKLKTFHQNKSKTTPFRAKP
jgi:hypothetical protein